METLAIVFVHGGSHGSWCWDNVVVELKSMGCNGPLITLDVPGCGTKRDRRNEQLTLTAIAAELNAEVSSRVTGSALLVGHSMSGILLPFMVALAPAQYSEACFLAACIPRIGESVADTMGTGAQGTDTDKVGWPVPRSDDPIAMYKAMFGPDMTQKQLDWVIEQVQRDDWPRSAAAESVDRKGFPGKTRISYIATERDPILPLLWQGRFAERIGAQTLYLLNTPHEPFVTHPSELADLIYHICGRLERLQRGTRKSHENQII